MPAQPVPTRVAEHCSQLSRDDKRWLHYALRTGLSGTSPIVADFEATVGRHYEIDHVIAVSSGAAAVTVALCAIAAPRSSEIVVSPTCPICTVLPMLERGLVPVFCDVRKDSFGLCPETLERLISPQTRAIFEVPMWGYPIPLDDTRRIANRHGVPLVLDLAHAHQTQLRGRYLAAYADIACFSTHEGKYISTGEGGFVTTASATLASRARAYTRYGDMDGTSVGINLKLGGLQAALGVARFPLLNEQREKRLENRATLLKRLDNAQLRELPVAQGGVPSGYALLLQTIGHDGRNLVRYQVQGGVPSDIAKYDNRPLYEYELLAPYRRECPNSAALLRSLTTVPIHHEIDAATLSWISAVLNNYQPGAQD
jgi:perosamine synthetase